MTLPYNEVVSTGLIVPDTSEILGDVQQEYKDAFNDQTLIVTPSLPQGVLITAESLARDSVINNNAAVANQINPNYSGGIFLDAIIALTGPGRNAQKPTVVPGVILTGVADTDIPVNAQAKTPAGDLFSTTSAVTFGADGTATVNFQSNAYGPIPCAEGDLNEVVTGIIGWESVTNPIAGTLGTTTQSDASARAFRNNTLAYNGVSLVEAITSALYNVAGVTSLTFQENTSAATATINDIEMAAHSVYACVEGGSDTDVAAALLENKSSGAGWNGATTINVIEPASGQSYAVQFDRPTAVPIAVKVTASNVSANAVIQAILDYSNGVVTDPAGNAANLQGFIVGADVSPFELASAIAIENPGAYISSITIAAIPMSGPPTYSVSPVDIGVNEIATIINANITVTIGS